MLYKHTLTLIFILTAALAVMAQGTVTPRDSDEEHAWRIHTKYKESRKSEDELTGQIALLRRDIATQSASTIGAFGSDAKDRERLTKLREQLTAEQAKLRKLEADWDQKFYGRYGYLQDSDATIVDPTTKRTMDKIEFRLINFPFNDAKKKEPPPPDPAARGSWKKVREKLWTNASTPNDPDQHHEQSGAPYELTYIRKYYDRYGTQRWLTDTSKASCKLDLLNANQVAPGQKVSVSCSLNYKSEVYTSNGGASIWAGDIPIQTPAGFKPDGSIYPFWGYRTDAVLRVSASNNNPGQATGQFSFPAKPRTDNEPFCIRLTSGISGVAAVEVCYEWQGGPVVDPAASGENRAKGRPANQSSRSDWSTSNDAQGAVDGVKNGSFGFHTASEPNPWWQVDLGVAKPISEVRVFNRLDFNPERARTLQVFVSNDGKNWTRLFANDGSIFGGADGHPLRVMLKGTNARFVRLQLAETTYFHLDEVEIY